MLLRLLPVASLAGLLLTSGCAVSTFKVDMDIPGKVLPSTIKFADARMDQQVSVSNVAWDGSTSVTLFDLSPPLIDGLTSSLAIVAMPEDDAVLSAGMLVTVEELTIKNRVGFGKPDDLMCLMQSEVTVGSGGAAKSVRVRTIARNDKDSDGFGTIAKVGRVIVPPCLREHAQAIWLATRANGSR